MARNKRPASWLVTLPVAAVSIAFMGLFFLPNMRAISLLRDELRTKQSYLAETAHVGTMLAAVETERLAAHDYVTQRKDVAVGSSHARLFSTVAEVIQTCGIKPKRFDPQPVQHYDTVTRQPVRIGWQGNYHDFMRVLHQLERLPHALWLEELNVELPREAGEGLHCELRLDAFASKSEESGQRNPAANR